MNRLGGSVHGEEAAEGLGAEGIDVDLLFSFLLQQALG
jgi:hypothetical protein